MEVESQSSSNFDVRLKPPFSYSLDTGVDSSEFHSLECDTSELSDSLSSDTVHSKTPVGINSNEDQLFETDGEKCPGFVQAPVSNLDPGLSEIGVSDSAIDAESPATEDTSDLKASGSEMSEEKAAVMLQKVYRSYRTRRRLADSAIVAEELWWQAIDHARLTHTTISFFHFSNPETAEERWNRIRSNAARVGKGLSEDANAQKLAFQHWIEAIDPRHRYGHSLHLYYEEWYKVDAGQPFFYWLDIGDGKEVDLKECPRSKLQKQCIKYLGPKERECYEYMVHEGEIVHKQTRDLLDTHRGLQGAKWIFVMSTSKKLYIGEKVKGAFHHSSFLAGGATLAAGRLVVEHGILKFISAYSGHYRPNDDSLDRFLSFLKENGVNLDEVQIRTANEDYENYDSSKSTGSNPSESTEDAQTETHNNYKRTLSGRLQKGGAEVSKKSIMQRMNSKKTVSSYQLGHQLSLKWTTGAGPRIGCVADYPLQLREQAMEFAKFSPSEPPTPSGVC